MAGHSVSSHQKDMRTMGHSQGTRSVSPDRNALLVSLWTAIRLSVNIQTCPVRCPVSDNGRVGDPAPRPASDTATHRRSSFCRMTLLSRILSENRLIGNTPYTSFTRCNAIGGNEKQSSFSPLTRLATMENLTTAYIADPNEHEHLSRYAPHFWPAAKLM